MWYHAWLKTYSKIKLYEQIWSLVPSHLPPRCSSWYIYDLATRGQYNTPMRIDKLRGKCSTSCSLQSIKNVCLSYPYIVCLDVLRQHLCSKQPLNNGWDLKKHLFFLNHQKVPKAPLCEILSLFECRFKTMVPIKKYKIMKEREKKKNAKWIHSGLNLLSIIKPLF